MVSSEYFPQLRLIMLAATVSVSIANLDWKSDTRRRFQWAYNCEFNGSDITTISSDKNDNCGAKCHENSECTHFAWHANTCYLKHFENQPTAIDFNKLDCGWISSRGSEPQIVYTPKRVPGWQDGIEDGVKWAKACQFYSPDETNLKTIPNRPEDLCRSDCAAIENCTNFNWNDGKCVLKMFNYPVPAYNYDGLTCGFVTRSNTNNGEMNAAVWEIPNRDGDLPTFPLEQDMRRKSSLVVNADEVLYKGLQQYLQFKDADLGTYLSYLINKRTQSFIDEYGQTIKNYKKVFRFIWEQYNETLVQNYAIDQFDKDKLDLCSVARFLSHQPSVDQRETIMKRMWDALGYRCHPCTPYKAKEWDTTIVPSTDGINPEISPEESLILCKSLPSTNSTASSVDGMPTSCQDLQLLGHTSNGLHLIKATQTDGGSKIEVVFCEFNLLPNLNGGHETRVGVVNVKSGIVHFCVERGFGEYGVQGQNIIFDKEILNVGNGFDWKNQWFIAPYTGTYFFSISGTKDWFAKNSVRASVMLKLNGEVISEAVSADNTTFGGFSSQISRKLNANDKIEVFMFVGKFYLLYFTGWLQDENLVL